MGDLYLGFFKVLHILGFHILNLILQFMNLLAVSGEAEKQSVTVSGKVKQEFGDWQRHGVFCRKQRK